MEITLREHLRKCGQLKTEAMQNARRNNAAKARLQRAANFKNKATATIQQESSNEKTA